MILTQKKKMVEQMMNPILLGHLRVEDLRPIVNYIGYQLIKQLE